MAIPWRRVLALGLAAGLMAAWAKNTVTTWIYEAEPGTVRAAEDAARGGSFAYDIAAQRVAHGMGLELSDREKAQAGQIIHWSLGVGSVLLYALLRERWPGIRKGYGLAFGLPFTWLFLDELVNPLLDLTPPPQRFPWQTHARAAVGHTVLWTVAEGTLRGSERAVLHTPERPLTVRPGANH